MRFSAQLDPGSARWALVLAVLMATPASHANPRLMRFFETVVGRHVITNTEAGVRLVERVTGTRVVVDHVTDGAFRSFTQRMGWREVRPLRDEVARELRAIEEEFAAYRREHGKPERLEANEQLTADEERFLETASERLRGNRIENLLIETRVFYDIPGGRLAETPAGARRRPPAGAEAAARLAREPEVPALPIQEAAEAAEPNVNLQEATMNWREKLSLRFRTYRTFFRVFRVSEGQWRSLFTQSGRRFTPADLELIRKNYRLFDVLNEYARMRLVIRSFAQERPYLYNRLNEKVAEDTTRYLAGELSGQEYLEIRKAAARELQLNDIVWESEQRMLKAIERCKELGGGRLGNREQRSLIDMSEDNIRAYQGHRDRAGRIMGELRGRRTSAQLEARSPRTEAARRIELEGRIRELDRRIVREQMDKDLWVKRIDSSAKELERMYMELVENYDSLELFKDLRRGRINSEEVQVFDMADPFTVDAAEYASWAGMYDRALHNSTHRLVLNETRAFFRSRVGATRAFVRDMNKMTGKYFGQKFTESPFGREFLAYNRHVATVFLQRLGGLIGITIPATLGVTYADKVWSWMFGETPDGGEPAPDPGSDPDSSRSSSRGGSTGDPSQDPTDGDELPEPE